MPQARQCKRRRVESGSQPDDLYPRKKLKLDYPTNNCSYPPHFFDKLSRIFLTKDALRELNRRNSPPHVQFRRPVTREYSALKGRRRQPEIETALVLPNPSKAHKLYARHGGPDLQNLRGHPAPSETLERAMSSSATSRRRRKQNSASTSSGTQRTKNTTLTKETGTSGAYNRNFTQHLIDHGIYPDGYEYPDGKPVPLPDDWEDFNQALLQERASLSPSQFPEETFREFRRADAAVINEGDAMRKIVPLIQGTKWDERRVQRDVLFSNLAHLTDGTLKKAKPDLYYGGRPEQLRRAIRQDLSQFVVPSTADNLPIAPNMFLEAKGPDGSAAVAQRQACYDGALGARGMQELLFYRREEQSSDSKIRAVSSTYQNGQLKLYAHHIARPNGPGTRPELFMHQANAWSMTGNQEGLKGGLKGFRNAADWADRRREEAISSANALFDRDERRAGVSEEATKVVVSDATDTSEDENYNYTRDNEDEEDESALSAPSRPLLTSFMSLSQGSGAHSYSQTDARTQVDSETSTDEHAAVVPVPAKRRSRSHCRSMSKRRARASSSSAEPR